MSLIEKLDGVLSAVSPLSSKSTPTDVMRASAKALDLLRDHGPVIRQAMIDAERLDWVSDLDNAMGIGIYGVIGPDLRQRIDKARATGEGEGNG